MDASAHFLGVDKEKKEDIRQVFQLIIGLGRNNDEHIGMSLLESLEKVKRYKAQ